MIFILYACIDIFSKRKNDKVKTQIFIDTKNYRTHLCKIERLIIQSNEIKNQYHTFKKWFNLSVDLWLMYIKIYEKLQEISIFKMRKITVYSLLIFVGLYLVCIKCNQFIHPVKDEEYEILLKLCKGEFSVPLADRSKLQMSTIIKFWSNREKFS